MNVYFDTEFTGLEGSDPDLISIGMISEDGHKFYAEFTDYDEKRINPWVVDNVLAYLRDPNTDDYCYSEMAWDPNSAIGETQSYVHGNRRYICDKLEDWFSYVSTDLETGEPKDIVLVGDVCYYDMYLLCNKVFNGSFDLPENLIPACYDICQDIAKLMPHDSMLDAFNATREDLCKAFNQLSRCELPKGEKHNALYDAEVIKAIYEGMHPGKEAQDD